MRSGFGLALRLLSLGWLVALSILLGVVGGLWLDGVLDTRPLFILIGLIIGSVHAKASLWKRVKERLNFGVTSKGQNLAISIYTIKSFLDENNVNYLTINKSEKKDREKIILEAKKYTVPLECWGKN